MKQALRNKYGVVHHERQRQGQSEVKFMESSMVEEPLKSKSFHKELLLKDLENQIRAYLEMFKVNPLTFVKFILRKGTFEQIFEGNDSKTNQRARSISSHQSPRLLPLLGSQKKELGLFQTLPIPKEDSSFCAASGLTKIKGAESKHPKYPKDWKAALFSVSSLAAVATSFAEAKGAPNLYSRSRASKLLRYLDEKARVNIISNSGIRDKGIQIYAEGDQERLAPATPQRIRGPSSALVHHTQHFIRLTKHIKVLRSSTKSNLKLMAIIDNRRSKKEGKQSLQGRLPTCDGRLPPTIPSKRSFESLIEGFGLGTTRFISGYFLVMRGLCIKFSTIYCNSLIYSDLARLGSVHVPLEGVLDKYQMKREQNEWKLQNQRRLNFGMNRPEAYHRRVNPNCHKWVSSRVVPQLVNFVALLLGTATLEKVFLFLHLFNSYSVAYLCESGFLAILRSTFNQFMLIANGLDEFHTTTRSNICYRASTMP
ncbi:hypothetical protein M9H77_30931 [Catharanthus roseus]|uniref:Uncharacterized protein n=1 Tax=Catharanthus roseus TaxID=4058 RepID=A0ACC0A0Q1_CATRO|nr:hypothetical protein M9H77_30931 [Catharanthus roseus]